MATVHDLIEVPCVHADTTLGPVNGNLVGVLDNVSSFDLNDIASDRGDCIVIGVVSDRIDRVREPSGSGRFTLGNGTDRSFDPGCEPDLSIVFPTVSHRGDIRRFIVPNDSFGM